MYFNRSLRLFWQLFSQIVALSSELQGGGWHWRPPLPVSAPDRVTGNLEISSSETPFNLERGAIGTGRDAIQSYIPNFTEERCN